MNGSTIKQILFFVLTLGLVACGNMPYQKCVNGKCAYYDKDGREMTEDQAAKSNPHFASQIQSKKTADQRREALKTAPRREPSEEVMVTILPVQTIAKGQVSIDPRTAAEWRKLFINSNPLKLSDDKSYEKYLKTLQQEFAKKKYHSNWFEHAAQNRMPGEVYVHTTLAVQDVTGIDKKTKALRVGNQLVIKAKISSTYEHKEYEIIEPITNFLQNQQSFIKLAEKVKAHINTTVRSEMPSLAWLRSKQNESRKQASEALGEAAKKWFNGEKNQNP